MKKIMLLSVIGMILLSEAAIASVSVINASPRTEIWVKFSLILHRPKFECLTGFGFCFSVNAGIDKMGNPTLSGCPVMMRINDRKQLIIQVTEENLRTYENGSALRYFKGQVNISLEDPTALNPELGRELGSTDPVIIQPGIYPVTFSNGTYTVTIPL